MFWILLRATRLLIHFCYAKIASSQPPRRFHRLTMTTNPANYEAIAGAKPSPQCSFYAFSKRKFMDCHDFTS
ncbi:hypothetical protein [Campylobacter troglodytis]|uniref:hypothetical protein n=1 Tax=Campylobacter troglodytis TaxID=654363 RepID=UPI001157252F|nr:hypothetical protein [Campylobacter troglodytis]